jgi:hypothetical protein
MLTDSHQQTTDCHRQSEVPPSRATQQRKKSRGQSMVEFAILLPTLVMILAIAADFGRAFTAYIAISGANVEAVVDADIGSGGSIWGTDVGVTSSLVADDGQGYEQVVVTVDYTFSPIIPLPALPSSIDMERTVTMRVLN